MGILDSLMLSMFGMPFSVVWTFAKRGLDLYGPTYVKVALGILLGLFLLKLFGLLNPGNLPQKQTPVSDSPLKDKNIIFLGSSVTKGFAAQGRSFVDMIAERTGAFCVKEAVSGTTLVDNGERSYVARLKKLDRKQPCDLFVCQLSTNDATKKLPLGVVSKSTELSSFDTKTVCGAIEYIIAYAKETWNAPVVFYTSPQYGSVQYQRMMVALGEIAEKWNIQVIDLWSNVEINAKKNKGYTCMNDQIHPTKKGYAVWVPVIESALADVLAGRTVKQSDSGTPTVKQVKKVQSRRTIKTWGLRIAAVALAIVAAFGYSAWQMFTNTTGFAKPGNANKYNPENLTPYENSPLEGKTILFLGSSVTQGYAAGGVSFVDYIEVLDSTGVIKEVMGGTTVANNAGAYTPAEVSYNPRLRKYDSSTKVDAVVIQLSSNDSTSGTPLGELNDTFDLDKIDDSTFTGGMESLIAYAKETWDCPIIVYSNPRFRVKSVYDTALYEAMVEKTKEVTDKWDVYYLDMWHDTEFQDISLKDYNFYMCDPVHPTKAGYLEWWTPKFEEALYRQLG